MRLERRVALLTALLICVTLTVGGWIMYADGRHLLDESESREIDATSLVLTTAIDQAGSLTVSHAELLARDDVNRALLKSGDRAGLQARMKPVLDRLKQEAGVDVLHFQTAGLKSFLRVWAPADFGQDLSRIRPMVLSANHTRLPQKGLEIGLKGLSLRAVSAMVAADQVIGTVEVGVSLSKLMGLANSSTGADFAIFLDPQFIPNVKGGFAERGEGLKLDASTQAPLFGDLQKLGLVKMTRQSLTAIVPRDNQILGVLSRPLLDYSGKMIGTLVVAKDFAAVEQQFRGTWITISVVSICGFLMAFAVLIVALRAFLFRPLERLAHQLERGETAEPTSSLLLYLRIREALLQAPAAGNEEEERR
jgi:sensor histidine kinase regulating citrate/malate metabolism